MVARRFRRPGVPAALPASALILLAVLATAPAAARPYLPPAGHAFAGLTGGSSIATFERLVGKHPPVFETYMRWDTSTRWLRSPNRGFRSRLALHISTSNGYGQPGVITPAAIAAGRSDGFLVALGRNLAHSRRIVYIRLMGEMNGYWNAYAAFSANGAFRGPQTAPSAYIAAWRRTVLILRGGTVRRLDARLRRLGVPPLQSAAGPRLARPRVAFLWVPQDAGSPDIAANAPGAYWPGGAYVDWVGTDFYASAPDFARLSAYYERFAGKPFVLSEWALYGADHPGFVRSLFAWAGAHPRVRMLNYYQGFTVGGPADLARYPAGRRALRAELRARRFLAYAPEYRRAGRGPSRPPRSPTPAQPPSPPILSAPGPGELCLLRICLGL